MSGTKVVETWHGSESLRPMLVAITELRAHPRNPRQGVVDEIARSLSRFGQQRPLLALPDGTLVAGHHVWRAAASLGWTHVALVRSDLADAEVEAYLLADNRLADLGLYDDGMLAELLRDLDDGDAGLDGTGYTRDDLAALLTYLGEPGLEVAPRGKRPAELPYGSEESSLFRIMLTYDRETYTAMIERLDELAEVHGVDSYSEVVEAVVRAAD